MKEGLFLLFLLSFVFSYDGPVIHTDAGPIQGFFTSTSQVFLGVPYAAPPLNELRWRPPTVHKKWTTVLNTTKFGYSCVQSVDPRINYDVNEDCLFLNVYTPLTITKPLPVMVWIHGGSFTSGAGSLYPPESLVTSGQLIVVTINYRLGPFGFLALPSLKNIDGTTGNYGFLDQQFALKWIKTNIGRFGGDSNQITLFGESAGAISICIHMAAPGSKGLYSGVIMESGFCNDMSTLSDAETVGKNFSQALGCQSTDLSCLRSKSSTAVLNALNGARWWPTIDKVVIGDQPIHILQNGTGNPVTGAILGTNLNEWSLFVCSIYENMTAAQFEDYVKGQYGSLAPTLLQIYNVNNYSQPVQALIDLGSDLIFKCPTRQAIRALANSSVPSYLYSFEHKPSYSQGNCLNVAHSYELPFVFTGVLNVTLNDREKQLSQAMITYWTQFANTVVNPMLGWPNYDKIGDENLVLDLQLDTRENYRKIQCDFWDQIL